MPSEPKSLSSFNATQIGSCLYLRVTDIYISLPLHSIRRQLAGKQVHPSRPRLIQYIDQHLGSTATAHEVWISISKIELSNLSYRNKS